MAGVNAWRLSHGQAHRLQSLEQEVYMSLTMILVIVLIIALLGGGGYYWRRW